MIKWLISPITNILNKGVDAWTTNKKIKAAVGKRKDDLKKLELKATIKGINTSSDLDRVNGSDPIPWANDLTLVLLLIPCVLAFYPPAVPAVKAGFIVLESMPVLYKYALGMAFVSIWGYRGLVVPVVRELTSNSIIGKKK